MSILVAVVIQDRCNLVTMYIEICRSCDTRYM